MSFLQLDMLTIFRSC